MAAQKRKSIRHRSQVKKIVSRKRRLKFLHKGKSRETALHWAINTVERSLRYKQHTLAGLQDIEEAFNNVNTKAVKETLTTIGLEEYLTQRIVCMLRTSIIQPVPRGSIRPELKDVTG